MIRGYQYIPHSSIPEVLAAFLEGQGHSMAHAVKVEIFMPGEGLNELEKGSEEYIAALCKHPLEDMRRFRLECTDGIGYQGYMAVIDKDCWCVRFAEMFWKID